MEDTMRRSPKEIFQELRERIDREEGTQNAN